MIKSRVFPHKLMIWMSFPLVQTHRNLSRKVCGVHRIPLNTVRKCSWWKREVQTFFVLDSDGGRSCFPVTFTWSLGCGFFFVSCQHFPAFICFFNRFVLHGESAFGSISARLPSSCCCFLLHFCKIPHTFCWEQDPVSGVKPPHTDRLTAKEQE